ncbi:MAG: hypothetical protein RR282_00750 [Acinetobacter sp.]
MAIEIDFSYVIDGLFTSVNYYRSPTPMNVGSMPTATATGITTTTYTDTTATKGNYYYVRFGSVKAGVEKISDELKILAGTAWTPNNLSSQIYLDADDLSASSISSWTDRKSGASFIQAAPSSQPALSAINGKKSVLFDGLNDNLECTNSLITGIFKNIGAGYLFVVSQKTETSDAGKDSPLVYFETPSTGYTRFGIFAGLNGNNENTYSSLFRRSDSDSAYYLNSTIASNDLATKIVSTEFDYSQPTCKFYVNSTMAAQSTPPFGTGLTSNTDSNRSMIGSNGAFYFKGNIAAIIAGNTVLSTQDRQKLEGWAAHKYGLLSSLPTGHPYKTNPPVV